MKKNIVLILILIFQFTTAQEKSVNENLKHEYNLMIESESYKDYEQAAGEYINKIYFRKKFYEMCYENIFLEVMKENIGNTSFKSYEEAEKEYFVLKEKYSVMKGSNKGGYLALKDSKQWDLADIIDPIRRPEVDPCHCESTYSGNSNVLAFNYENVLKNKEESVVSTWIIYQKIKSTNQDAYKMCKLGCEQQ
ncbi:hypothetical protein ABS768_16350 [Flavobacterium sp. ST-75]|uniref:GLPGLI family protein n=1 Tax=Flavobacterium rhizophilum TaxID=3163296 RepID=A0ABW8YGN3_9FLAO